MKQIPIVDANGVIVDYKAAQENELNGSVVDNDDGTFTIYARPTEGINSPVFDFTANDFAEGKTDAELLEQAKAEKIGEISKACRDSIVNGYAVAINSTDTYTYESELHDQRNLALKGLKVMMDTNITSVDHKTIEFGTVTHTRDEFLLVVSEADTHIDKNVDKYRSLKQRVKDATTITDVENITW